MKRLLKSSKFWAAVLGAAIAIGAALIGEFPIETTVEVSVVLIGLFIGATAAEDVAAKLRGTFKVPK